MYDGSVQKLCYSCKEHEMRPLPDRKTGRELVKIIRGAFRYRPWLEKLSQNNMPHRNSGGISIWLRWTVSPDSWNVHRHLSSGRVRMERSRKAMRGREGEVTESVTCSNIQIDNLTSGSHASPPCSCLSPLLTSRAAAEKIIPLHLT